MLLSTVRKAVIFLLVFFFILNSTAFYLMLEIQRYRMKSDLELHAVKRNVEVVSIEEKDLPARIIRTGKKEISYQGKLYDVIREARGKGYIRFYCIRDTKEENILGCMNHTGTNKLISLLLDDLLKMAPDGRQQKVRTVPPSELVFPFLEESSESLHPSVITPPPERA
jgi:hypothetical protein